MFSIFAMFSRDSVALACKIFNSSSIIHLGVSIAGKVTAGGGLVEQNAAGIRRKPEALNPNV